MIQGVMPSISNDKVHCKQSPPVLVPVPISSRAKTRSITNYRPQSLATQKNLLLGTLFHLEEAHLSSASTLGTGAGTRPELQQGVIYPIKVYYIRSDSLADAR